MFPYVLVLLSFGEPPDAIATFKVESSCQALASAVNKEFDRKNEGKKAICITATKNGDI